MQFSAVWEYIWEAVVPSADVPTVKDRFRR